ncbi:MAG: hypothetical protein IJF52_04585 [Clostridia bacterium]|nr:hypothetical protein [Clostridia bacterium]
MKKRFISLFIATAAIISACCGIFYVQNQATETAVYTEKDGESFSFSLDIAKKSLRLCSLAGYAASISARLENVGFCDVEFFQYENMNKSDNKAGLVLAFKGETLLAVIRGTKDEEWYSNFYIGDGSEHAGFSKAADLVIKNIEDYSARHSLDPKNTTLFLTGHSRGAAVANLTAARFIDKKGFKDISAYTFACPNTTMLEKAQSKDYESIINIINPQDFICYIPLPQWGYTRYGQSIELPDFDTDNFDTLYNNMKKSYRADTASELKDFPHKSKDVESIISYLSILAPTPEDYYEKEIAVGGFRLTMQDYMMKLAAVMSGENPLLHGLFMLSCKAIPEVCPITEFVFSGIKESQIMSDPTLTKTPVVVNHMHEAYFAWLNTLEEGYFSARINNY